MVDPRLFLFDVDGTLVHVGGSGRRALGNAFGDVFGVADPLEVMKPIRFDGSTDRLILREAITRAGLDAARFDACREEFDAAYLRHLRALLARSGTGRALPGVASLLETLEARGDALGLMTGNTEAGARAKLEPFGLNRFFRTGAFGSDHGDRRELAGLARRRVEEWTSRRFVPRDVFVLGDSVMDVRSGKAHGFQTVAVVTGWTPREALAAEEPDYLCEDLRGLPAEVVGPGPR